MIVGDICGDGCVVYELILYYEDYDLYVCI